MNDNGTSLVGGGPESVTLIDPIASCVAGSTNHTRFALLLDKLVEPQGLERCSPATTTTTTTTTQSSSRATPTPDRKKILPPEKVLGVVPFRIKCDRVSPLNLTTTQTQLLGVCQVSSWYPVSLVYREASSQAYPWIELSFRQPISTGILFPLLQGLSKIVR